MISRRWFARPLRIAAFILCGTFSITQVAPAWAMRAEGAASPGVKAGLEERLVSGQTSVPAATIGSQSDWEAMGILPGFTPVGRVEVSASSSVPMTSWSLAQGFSESRWRWIGGVHSPGSRSAMTLFKKWVRIDWPMVQWALSHPDKAVEKWMGAPIADLIAAIQDGQTAAVAAAIRRDCAFCATIGEIPSARPAYEPDEPPIDISQFAQLSGYLTQHGIQNVLGATRPVYLVTDDDQDIQLTVDSGTVQFTVFTGTIRSRPPTVTLNVAQRQQVEQYLQRRTEVRALRPAKPSEDPAGFAAWREAQQQLMNERRQLFDAVVKTASARAEFRNALFEEYAGGRARISEYLALSWQLKRFGQFAHLLANGARQPDFNMFVSRLDQLIKQEDDALAKYQEVFADLSPEDREIVLRTLVDLKDLSWNIHNDLLGNIERVRILGGISPDRADSVPTPTIQRLWALTMLLNGIDSRMETRGRDSLGASVMATFENQAAYEAYLQQLGGKLQGQLRDRQRIVDLGNLSVRVRPGVNEHGVPDPTRPVTVTFIYKVAEVVGYLGDNAKAIRQAMISDQAFQLLLRQPLRHFTAVAHTRWASAGGISIPNTHPVTNEGNYVFPPGFQAMEYGAIPLDDGSFQMVAQITTALPHYGRNGHVFVVLNGDVDNYNRERLGKNGFFPNLMDDYVKLRGPWQSRRISLPRTSDTPWISFRIEDYLLLGYDLLSAVQHAAREFDGSFAIQVQSDLEPGKLILALNGKGQGLYVGISPDGFHPASETYGFIDVTQQFYRLKPGQIVLIDQSLPPMPESLVVTTLDGKHLPITARHIERTSQTTRDTQKGQYERFFVKEVGEASDMFRATVLGRALVRQAGLEEKTLVINLSEEEFPSWIRTRLREGWTEQRGGQTVQRWYRRIIITGMGTAHAAGLVVADALKDYISRGGAKHPLTIETPLAPEMAAYTLTADMTDTLIVVISQSGKSTDTNDPLGKAIEAGATPIGIINTRDSDAVFLIRKNEKDQRTPRAGDEGDGGVLYTGTGRDIELAVASTKAYYAQIAAGVILAIQIARELGVPDAVFMNDVEELHRLPEKMRRFEQSVTQSKGQHPLIKAAEFFPLFKIDWAIVSSGPGMAAAREAVIKLSELCYRCIYQDSMVNLKHVNYSAEPWVLMLLANLHGVNDFVQTNGEGELDKMLAQALAATVVVEEKNADGNDNTRFDGRTQTVFDVTGAESTRPVDVIKVPNTTERFAPIFLTMASHLLAYYAAEAINARGRALHNALNAVTAVRAKLLADGTNEARLVRTTAFQAAVRKEFGPILQAIRAGYFNVAAKDPRRLVEFALLLPYLTGDLDLSTTEFYLGNAMIAAEVWARFEAVTVTLARGATRTIDAIARQAKYVTVGAKTGKEQPGNVQALIETFRDHPTTKLDRQTLLELALAYQRYRAANKPVSVVIPDPAAPFARSKVITVADDAVGVRHGIDEALGAKRVSIGSSLTDGFHDGERDVTFVIDTIARPVTAMGTLQVGQTIEERLAIGAVPNGEHVGPLVMHLVGRGRMLDRARLFGTLYEQYLRGPGLYVSDTRPDSEPKGRTPFYIAFPYEPGGHAQQINSAVVPRMERYLQTLLTPGDSNAPVEVPDHFVAIYYDTPDEQPVAFVSVSLNNADLDRLSVDFRGNASAVTKAIVQVLGEYIQRPADGGAQTASSAGVEEGSAADAVRAMQDASQTYARLYAEIMPVPALPTPADIRTIYDQVAAGELSAARIALLDIFGRTRGIRYEDESDSHRYVQMMGSLAVALDHITQAISPRQSSNPWSDLLEQGLREINEEFGRNPAVGAAATEQLKAMFRQYVTTGQPQRWLGRDPTRPTQVLFLSIQPDTRYIDEHATRVMSSQRLNSESLESETILRGSRRPIDVLAILADEKTSTTFFESGAAQLEALAGQLKEALDHLVAQEAMAWAARQAAASAGLEESPAPAAEGATVAMRKAYDEYVALDAAIRSRPWGLPSVGAIEKILGLVNAQRFTPAYLALLELSGQSRLVIQTGNSDTPIIQQMYAALGRAAEAIKPFVLTAGLEEVATATRPAAPLAPAFQISAEAVSQKIVIVPPNAVSLLHALALLKPADGPLVIPVVAVVQQDQREAAEQAMRYLGLSPEFVVPLAPGESVQEAIGGLTRWYQEQGFSEPLVVEDEPVADDTLRRLAQYLGLPDVVAFAQAAVQAIRDQALGRYL